MNVNVYNPQTLDQLDLHNIDGLLSDVFMDAILNDNITPEQLNIFNDQ